MTDSVKGYIYQKDVRLKIAALNHSLTEIKKKRGFISGDMEKFTPAALFAAIYATEQKDDDGSVYISFKFPQEKKAYTAICETDGRLRGYGEDFSPSGLLKNEILFVSGVRLALRGDYQSAVAAPDIPQALAGFYADSRQTKAELLLFTAGEIQVLAIAEYLPGHDVNYRSGQKILTENEIRQKLRQAVLLCRETLQTDLAASLPPDFEEMFSLDITFGCTCSKRKIKQALLTSGEEIPEFPIVANCKLCGKEYIIQSL